MNNVIEMVNVNNQNENESAELITVNYANDRPTVSGRDLHAALEVGTRYNDWFPRMCEYGFTEGVDFNLLKNEQVQFEGNREVKREITDHQITIAMAKEICMIQRSDAGKKFRQYFIKIEEAWNTPEAIMARALTLANKSIENLKNQNQKLNIKVLEMQPKADYFDALVDRNLLTNFRDTAKQLDIKERDFINFLINRKYIYRDKKGKLKPYADKNDGLFEIKEFVNKNTGFANIQTLITPKGRETFRLLYTENIGA